MSAPYFANDEVRRAYVDGMRKRAVDEPDAKMAARYNAIATLTLLLPPDVDTDTFIDRIVEVAFKPEFKQVARSK